MMSPGAQAGGVGVGSLRDLADQRAARVRRAQLLGDLRRQRHELHAGNGAALDFAVLQQVVHHVPREVARDREADALVAAASR